MMNILEKKHAILAMELDRYVIEHPEFEIKIPRNAQIVLQVEGDQEYNKWSKQLAERQREPDQKVVYIKVRGLKPAKLRLLKPKVAIA